VLGQSSKESAYHYDLDKISTNEISRTLINQLNKKINTKSETKTKLDSAVSYFYQNSLWKKTYVRAFTYNNYGQLIKSITYLIDKQIIEGLESPIKIGKESNVFSGIRKYNNKRERVAVKIYRIGSSDFNKMLSYLKLDPRFKALGSKRQTISTWAKREFRNLNKAYKAGVRCPNPIAVKNNVLVMEFIGNKNIKENPIPAPLLNQYPPSNPEKFFKQLKQQMRLLFQKAKLVHSDLSEFNILNH